MKLPRIVPEPHTSKRCLVITRLSRCVALFALLSFASRSVPAQTKSGKADRHAANHETQEAVSIHQEVDFKASPERLYDALLDSKQFSEFTAQSKEFSAGSAKIDRAEGGAFTLFDGYITGRTIELVPNQRIVQAWHDKEWPAGVYSIVKFEFKRQGSGTHLVFDHTAFPPRARDHLAAGWKLHYWDPISAYLR